MMDFVRGHIIWCGMEESGGPVHGEMVAGVGKSWQWAKWHFWGVGHLVVGFEGSSEESGWQSHRPCAYLANKVRPAAETLNCVCSGILEGFVSVHQFPVVEDHPFAEVIGFQPVSHCFVDGYLVAKCAHGTLYPTFAKN